MEDRRGSLHPRTPQHNSCPGSQLLLILKQDRSCAAVVSYLFRTSTWHSAGGTHLVNTLAILAFSHTFCRSAREPAPAHARSNTSAVGIADVSHPSVFRRVSGLGVFIHLGALVALGGSVNKPGGPGETWRPWGAPAHARSNTSAVGITDVSHPSVFRRVSAHLGALGWEECECCLALFRFVLCCVVPCCVV